jgi:hypothetical protein
MDHLREPVDECVHIEWLGVEGLTTRKGQEALG